MWSTRHWRLAMLPGSPLGVIARAKGMTEVAREAGVTREALYKSLSGGGDPRLTTLLGVTRALGMTLAAQVSVESKARPSAMDEAAADTSI